MLRFSAAVTTSLMLLVAGAPAGAADEIRATSGLTTAPEVRTEIDSATYVVDRLGRLVTVAVEHAWVPCMDDQGNRADDAWLRDRLLVSRLTDKGDPDPTWGPPRRVTIPNFSYMVDVWIDEADRIHLSAQAETLSRVNPDDPCGPPPEYPENTPNVTRMVEMRLTPHGAPDETFGPGGIREARDEATPDELLNLPYPPSYSRKGPDGENLTVSATNRRYAVDPQGRVVAAVDHVATNATNDEWRVRGRRRRSRSTGSSATPTADSSATRPTATGGGTFTGASTMTQRRDLSLCGPSWCPSRSRTTVARF